MACAQNPPCMSQKGPSAWEECLKPPPSCQLPPPGCLASSDWQGPWESFTPPPYPETILLRGGAFFPAEARPIPLLWPLMLTALALSLPGSQSSSEVFRPSLQAVDTSIKVRMSSIFLLNSPAPPPEATWLQILGTAWG